MQVYIAYMGALPEKASYSPMSHHQNILQEVIELSSVEDSLVRSYGRSFNGFAAKLTESERDKLAGMEGVVSVFPDTLYKPLTTRSYEFMGLGDKSKRVPNIETDIIVGVIDHGIWPESKSFSDEGIGPIPKKWKGVCAGGTNFTCNTKVIGARYYVQDSARDKDSHGSHTASTAAGNIVEGVSMNGLAKGTARGVLGRIAIYRVCEPVGCNGASVLAAFDDAIADGVDVITISLGGVVLDLYVDPIAIGSFHAMTRGIVTTAAFGNAGPNLQTGQNVAPWIISVAAGYTDRKFVTTVVNGDAKAFPGKWINEFDLEGQMYPLAYGKTASNSCTEEQARLCASGCLNTVQGKIVVCDTLNNVTESREAGAVGTILYDFHIPAPDPIPLAVLDYSNFNAFTSYVLTSPDPRGTILRSKTVKDNDAPFVASFSSRGPNTLFSDIMKVYIAYMGALPEKASYSPMSHHQNILQEVIESSSVEDSLVRSYGRSFNGFAAKLTESERDKLAGMDGVVSVFPNTVYKLLTTRSYEFMGLGDKSKHVPEVETDIIVGVLDGGIWPESKSFSDEGIGPIPKKWKGICAGGTNFTCNKKLIGARHYVQDSARDKDSHGSHTASTAAGNIVEGVSMNGLAKGTARGGVPLGRIAIYRVCEPAGCNAASLLGAFDDAIADGVDVITISIGGGVVKVDVDPIAIGSFHAMTKGIVTTASSGNDGSKLGNARNVAPWIISVAAGYTDRKFVTTVVNGDAIALPGKSINDFDLEGQMYTLAYGKTASNNCTEEQARRCASGCLNTVQGKIVVCDTWNNVMESREAGAVGTILHINVVDIPGPDPIPVAVLNDTNYEAFRSYVLTSPNPRGTILRSKTVKDNDAPFVASFSSRGPNSLFSDIMKPDITAPGVNILAAYSPMSPTAVPGQSMDYYFMSGTSMACPHVGGVAAYIKTFHPDWSPSAVKSAIMTTAWPMNASKNAEAEFAYGSGHVNPTAAVNPGLVYEISKEDYLNMLCSLDYSADGISILAGGDFTCSEESKVTVRDLNYPSMTAKVSASSSSDITFSRTVTNVGKDGSTYKAKLSGDPKLNINVDPETLSFESSGDKKSFTVTVSGNSLAGISGIVSASLVWSDGSHNVRSPIVVYT
ncbi:unnamed protein product [Brassica rapa]|uniref:Uncharacterized protein n=1 Tax=Brassica campestris TaxID=3711 RepID=A0A8D9DF84_BRACM|nr:unnamed protein product [Brassica rapa]